MADRSTKDPSPHAHKRARGVHGPQVRNGNFTGRLEGLRWQVPSEWQISAGLPAVHVGSNFATQRERIFSEALKALDVKAHKSQTTNVLPLILSDLVYYDAPIRVWLFLTSRLFLNLNASFPLQFR